MRISFDIDDTLCCGPRVPSDPPVARWQRRRYPEQLRLGTRALLTDLRARDCDVWIYTSSRRPLPYLRGWFRAAGIPVEGAINMCHHERVVGYRGPSKCPPAFGIDLHVDDSIGVGMEGEAGGFDVIVVDPMDLAWTQRVLAHVDTRLQQRGALSAVRGKLGGGDPFAAGMRIAANRLSGLIGGLL